MTAALCCDGSLLYRFSPESRVPCVLNASKHVYVAIDPVAISAGPVEIHWYGIMYLLAFLFFWAGGNWLANNRKWWGWSAQDVSDFLFYGMLGVVIGGRLGYVFFYSFDTLLQDPLYLFKIAQGGMSFHGGLLGVMAAVLWFARRTGRSFWQVADFITPLGTIGLGFGRIGNFIGGELWGRLSAKPWAMIFPNSIESGGWQSEALRQEWMGGTLDQFARHPSQLYQAILEGFVLFLILAIYSRKPRPAAAVSGLFLTGYGCFRFIVEFFREPDQHLGFLAGGWLTMGMILSLPMVVAGLLIMLLAYKYHPAKSNQQGGK
jgi:phosphatidylglycerol:prolipoprotein diacylglycerol transferase